MPENIDLNRKLDMILQILQGTPNNPGVLEKIQNHDDILHGSTDGMGLITKLNIIWKSHIWVVGMVGMAVGYGIKTLIK